MDVTEATFQTDVVDRSHEVPVVVDFWAAWCGPCRQLTPALERVIGERDGQVVLAKVDVDANQGLARAFGVQGIPAVKAFRDGKVVAEFTGAIPESAVARFVDQLVPTEADLLAESGARTGSEDDLRRALELDPRHQRAGLTLAGILAERGGEAAIEEALTVLRRLSPTPEVSREIAELELAQEGEADPEDPAARALAKGDYASALGEYLERVRTPGDEESREEAREAMVRIFTALGDDDPLVVEFRPKLASALF